jgi:hypothetical protein
LLRAGERERERERAAGAGAPPRSPLPARGGDNPRPAPPPRLSSRGLRERLRRGLRDLGERDLPRRPPSPPRGLRERLRERDLERPR